MPDSVFAKHRHLRLNLRFKSEADKFKVAFVGGIVLKGIRNEGKNMPHTMNSGKPAFFGQFVSLSCYTSVRSHRKQHVHWSCLGKQLQPNIYTPHLHFFPLAAGGNSSYDGVSI